MSVTSLGAEATCGTLTCNKLNAKAGGGDIHKITGDLEVTGDLIVDGSTTFTNKSVNDEFELKAFTGGSGEVGMLLNDNTNKWRIEAYAPTNQLEFSVDTGGGSELTIATFNTTGGCTIPAATLNLASTTPPTPAAAVPSTHKFAITIDNVVYELLLNKPP